MLDVAPSELLILGTVALLVIPPKDLPKAMRAAGYWVGKARGVARQFRSGFDTMLREAELAEMEKRWAEENARIMREHSPERLIGDMTGTPAARAEEPALPLPAPTEPTADRPGEPSVDRPTEPIADRPAEAVADQPTLFDAGDAARPSRAE